MEYIKAEKYNKYMKLFMGPNPIKLEEELLDGNLIEPGSLVIDLGSGMGLTSVFLVKEYGFRVFAADLWSDPTENKRFFDSEGLTPAQLMPIHADANELPFAHESFDAAVCTDSYNYFGRDPEYLDKKLLPFVRRGGYVYIAIPGMKKDLHDCLPEKLLLSWTPEQLDYIHDIKYWTDIISKSQDAEIISIHEMQGNDELWGDWIKLDNEYAVNDRKAVEAGACELLNFIAIILKRK